jgi:hypothetical protein
MPARSKQTNQSRYDLGYDASADGTTALHEWRNADLLPAMVLITSVTVIWMLSPGMTISTRLPAVRSEPVTSVVRK